MENKQYKQRIRNIIIFLVIMVAYGCNTKSLEEQIKSDYDEYQLSQYMRENIWYGLGDSLTNYPVDSILYNGLHINGKSLNEMTEIYGDYRYISVDTINYGISRNTGLPSMVFPLTFRKPQISIIYVDWLIEGDITLSVFFENINDSTYAIYGYQFDNALKYE